MTSPDFLPIDVSRCPLCGQANQCAITAGLPPQSCWCMQTCISKEALTQLDPNARGKACICPGCAQITGTETSD